MKLQKSESEEKEHQKSITKSIHQNKKENPQLFAGTGYMPLVILTKLRREFVHPIFQHCCEICRGEQPKNTATATFNSYQNHS